MSTFSIPASTLGTRSQSSNAGSEELLQAGVDHGPAIIVEPLYEEVECDRRLIIRAVLTTEPQQCLLVAELVGILLDQKN